MGEMTSLDRDRQSRNRIVSEINTNFFVEAGAGSGKTTMLVSRMVAMVEAGIPIDKICAITFTKAAAGEFYDRFQKLLIERSNPDYAWEDKGFAGQLLEPTDKTRELCAEALKNIDLCFMGTIDSFCGMVLSEHPSEANIPSDASIVSDEDAAVFYKQQYVKICAGDYGKDLADMAGFYRAFHRNAEEVFVRGESVFMNNRNVHFNYSAPNVTDIDKAFDSERDEIIKAVKCLVEHPELKYESEQKNLAAWDKIGDIYKNVKRKWSTNFSNVMYFLKSFRDIRLIPEALDKYGVSLTGMFESGGKNGKWLECSIGKEGGLYLKLQNLQYSVSMKFLESCVPILEEAMRDKGYMTYFDYLYYLRNMLKKDAEGSGKLIRYIYDRHSYFLIDEFQDTNPMQAEVFFYLTSENPVSQWSACVPRPGSLFIVGDPKQSIYRFRSADVTSFLKVKGLFEKNGGSILSLSRNFRSVKKLCDYFNDVFTVMLKEETVNQSKYEEIPLPDEKDDEFQGTYTYTAYTGALEDEYPEKTDPKQIAKIIEALVNNDKYKVRGLNDKEPRNIRYDDIMVITYGKKKLGPIMSYLDERGIPTRVEGEVPFGDNEALIEIYKIYAAVADAEDAISLYGALTGKLIGLNKEEIVAFKTNGGEVSLRTTFDLDSCKDKTVCHVASKVNELKELHHKADRLSPAALFAKILDDYRVYNVITAENLEIVYYTLELLRNAEKSGLVVSLKDGASYIAELINSESGEERCLSLNDRRDAVHMANLHKVKGLEAPIIILSAVTKFVNSADKRIVHGDTGSEGYFFSLSKDDNKGSYFETKELQNENDAEKAAGDAENQRLIYVAATRARNALIICDSMAKVGRNEGHKSEWKPIMTEKCSDLFAAIDTGSVKAKVSPETVDSVTLYEDAEKSCAINDRSCETQTYTLENPSRLELTSKVSEEQGINVVQTTEDTSSKAINDGNNVSEIHKFPALLGTMTHKLMEMLVSTKNTVDAAEAVSEITKEYRTPVIEPYEKDLAKALTEVAEKMRSGGYPQTNGLPKDMLGTLLGADEVYCEVPFCYLEDEKDGKKLWNGVMDVVYCKDSKWHIVDYKTNADGNDLDTKYKNQLEAYIKAFKATTGNDADAFTYHLNI